MGCGASLHWSCSGWLWENCRNGQLASVGTQGSQAVCHLGLASLSHGLELLLSSRASSQCWLKVLDLHLYPYEAFNVLRLWAVGGGVLSDTPAGSQIQHTQGFVKTLQQLAHLPTPCWIVSQQHLPLTVRL